MAVNYAEKYSPLVDEAFYLESKTDRFISKEYDWVGVNAVNVYQISTASLGNYSMTGMSRYGTPAELNATKTTYTLTQDKAFTFTVDKRNNLDTMGALAAASALAREVREVIIPTVDTYRLSTLASNAGTTHTVATTKSNAYEEFLKATLVQDEKKVPQVGRVAFVTPVFYNKIKQDENFTKTADGGLAISRTGMVGTIDGVQIVNVPSSLMPADTTFILCQTDSMLSPFKIQEYKIHENVPGLSGSLVEGRMYYDTFVLGNKADGIVWHKEK